jgi:Domain of unknown function (DUF1902)
MTKRVFEVRAEWDEQARVWIATSTDVPAYAARLLNTRSW